MKKILLFSLAVTAINAVAIVDPVCSVAEFIEVTREHHDCVKTHVEGGRPGADRPSFICDVIQVEAVECGSVFGKYFEKETGYNEAFDTLSQIQVRKFAGLVNAIDLQCGFAKPTAQEDLIFAEFGKVPISTTHSLHKDKKKAISKASTKCSGPQVNILYIKFKEYVRCALVKLTKKIVDENRTEVSEDLCAGLDQIIDEGGDMMTPCFSSKVVEDFKSVTNQLIMKMITVRHLGEC